MVVRERIQGGNRMKDYSKFYNKGNDCDACENQYMCGRDGDELGCRCADEDQECNYIEQEEG